MSENKQEDKLILESNYLVLQRMSSAFLPTSLVSRRPSVPPSLPMTMTATAPLSLHPPPRTKARTSPPAVLSLPPHCRRCHHLCFYCHRPWLLSLFIVVIVGRCCRCSAIALPLPNADTALSPLPLPRCPSPPPNCHASRCRRAATTIAAPPPPLLCCCRHCRANANTGAATKLMMSPPPPRFR